MRIKRISRAVATLLLLALLFSMSPVQAFADDTGQDAASTVTEDAVTAETSTAAETEATAPTETDEPQEARSPDPDTESADGRYPGAFTLGYHLWRSNTVQSGWGGIYPARGAGSLSYSWTRNDGTTAYKTFAAAGDTEGVGIIHYMPYTDDNDPLASVYSAEVAYCIEPDKLTVNCQMYDCQSESSSEILSSLLSQDKIKAIKLACAYGWPYGFSDAYGTSEETAFKRQYATQIIVWEIIMGLRGSGGTYAATNPSLKNHYWGDPWSSYYGNTNDAFQTAYDEINARLARHNIYPSFAASTAAGAPVHSMTYNSATGKYTITLTDTNGVLSPDFDSFDQPTGVAVTKNGNTLTISATEAAMASGEVTVSMTGKKKEAGTAYIWTADYRQTLASISDARAVPAYFKLKADTKTISLKKTSSASASVMACIQGNPRYTLQGAVYEIRQGSATGPVVETLTTDANGNATGTGKYAVGTELYAIEKTAPAGYLLNATPVKLTVSADSSQNVFNVSDEPTFDPRAFRIKKTGTDSEYIPNTIFKADFYASTWMDSNYLQRTWYLKSDSAGIVQFDDAHLLSSYGGNSSDELFKPNGPNNRPSFPLGCVYIQEIQAADGYITPVGKDGGVLIFIDPDSSGKAVAYWGDAAGKPITTQNPKGIFRMENDSDGTVITAVNRQQTRLEIVKTSTDGKVSGISFTVEKETEVSGSWMLFGTYETDASGKILIPDLEAGQTLRITETVPNDYVSTGENPQIITLAEGLNTVSFSNKPVARLEIVKTSTDGKVSGISFKVEKEVAGSWTGLGTYETNASGKINLSDLEVGQKLRITEIVPADYVCTGVNPQIITLKKGLNTVSFSNKPVARLEIVKTSTDGKVAGIGFKVEKEVSGNWMHMGFYTTDENGKIQISDLDVGQKLRITEQVPADYVCTSENPQIITLKKGLNAVSFANKPVTNLEIVKTSTDGKVSGISFKVEKEVSGSWTLLGTYKTDASGKILIPGLDVGQKLRITELVPSGYVCTSENPQIITLQKAPAVNSVSFHNKPVRTLEIIKTSPDGKVEGIQFIVFVNGREVGTYESDANGKINVDGLDVGMTVTVTEIVPEGYLCLSENPQTITITAEGRNAVRFENEPIFGHLELTKVDEEYPDHKLSGAEFTVTMSLADGSTETAVMEEVLDASGKGTGVYRLNHIAYGTVCKVKETKAPEGYLLSDKEFEVTIQEQKTYIIADAGFDSVTNRRIYGDLELTKVDEDYPDHKLSGAEFTVTMSLADGSTETAVMEEVLDASGKRTGVYRLNHIAYGTVCKVKETKAPEGYLLSDKEFEVTIQEQKIYVIKDKDFNSVTNKQMVGKILVHKENDKGQPMAGVTYLLEYSLDDGETWQPIQGRGGDSPVQAGYSTSANIVDGCITTGEDGIAEFTGLAINNATHTIKYRLTEVKTQDGYNLLSEPVFEGFLTAEQAELTYKIVNHRVFEMPMTGSSGFTVSMLGLALSLLAALFILFNLPRKKEEK